MRDWLSVLQSQYDITSSQSYNRQMIFKYLSKNHSILGIVCLHTVCSIPVVKTVVKHLKPNLHLCVCPRLLAYN